MDDPKVFISYSWSSQEHEQWVLDLATDLVNYRVDVTMDKWDLKEGHDAIAFMEKMVVDSSITKVVMVIDRVYAEKADGRIGGVGTETQIISKEVYEKQDQNKFVAVISEKDENGNPYLPAYYKPRIYIDLSEPDKTAENFEKLLRWIYDKPLHVKPEKGERPSFLNDDTISLGTSLAQKRAVSAIREGKPFAAGALQEYFNTFTKNLEKFRLTEYEGVFDDAVVKNIEQFIPFRNEAIQVFLTISQYAPKEEFITKTHRFFESLIPYMKRPEQATRWMESGSDNFRFIIHELFLYVVAILIKSERFEEANYLLGENYYLAINSEYGLQDMVNFTTFRENVRSLKDRNERLCLNRLSLHADLLNERSKNSGIQFKHLMQADFILFMRAEIEDLKNGSSRWWPETLVYIDHFPGPFEVFARSTSKKYFEKIKCLLSIGKPRELKPLLELYESNERNLPRWQFESFYPTKLIGYDQLSIKE